MISEKKQYRREKQYEGIFPFKITQNISINHHSKNSKKEISRKIRKNRAFVDKGNFSIPFKDTPMSV